MFSGWVRVSKPLLSTPGRRRSVIVRAVPNVQKHFTSFQYSEAFPWAEACKVKPQCGNPAEEGLPPKPPSGFGAWTDFCFVLKTTWWEGWARIRG